MGNTHDAAGASIGLRERPSPFTVVSVSRICFQACDAASQGTEGPRPRTVVPRVNQLPWLPTFLSISLHDSHDANDYIMLGRLFHLGFDAIAVSTILSGVKKTTGFA